MRRKRNAGFERQKELADYRLPPRDKTARLSSQETKGLFLTFTELLGFGYADDGGSGYSKIGWGEFTPALGTRATDFIRHVFLYAIRKMEREEWDLGSDPEKQGLPEGERLKVLRDLSGEPFVEFQKARVSEDQLLRLNAHPDASEISALRSLQKAVRNWARRWHMDASWCLSVAFITLQLWHDYPLALELSVWGDTFPLDKATTELPKEIVGTAPLEGLPPFFAHFELRSNYVRRIHRLIESHLLSNPFTAKLSARTRLSVLEEDMKLVSDYCDCVMEFYRGQRDDKGEPVWTEVDERMELDRNIRWTIDFQVRGKAFLQIARDEKVYFPARGNQSLNHGTVIKAVDDLLQLIGLQKRSDAKRGRPPKRKGDAKAKRRA